LAADWRRAILRFPYVEFRRAPSGAGRDTVPRPAPDRLTLRRAAARPWLAARDQPRGHRLLAIIARGELRLISRNVYDPSDRCLRL